MVGRNLARRWLLALAAVVGLGGCAGGGSATASPVVATTSIWADVVANVACGGDAEVTTIVPRGADPHAFEPSLSDREVLGQSTLVVANGRGLESGLVAALDAVAADGVPVVEMTELMASASAGAGDPDDPHVWFDPIEVRAALDGLGAAVVAAGIADEATVAACVSAYAAELAALDREIATTVGTVPAERRVLVTNHDSLRRFADRYGLDVVGTVIPSSSTLAEASPAQLSALADAIRATGVPAVFAEATESTDVAERLASAAGVEVVTLYTGSLGEPGSGAETYLDLMRTDARLIAAALSR